jgi:hypothetical protein
VVGSASNVLLFRVSTPGEICIGGRPAAHVLSSLPQSQTIIAERMRAEEHFAWPGPEGGDLAIGYVIVAPDCGDIRQGASAHDGPRFGGRSVNVILAIRARPTHLVARGVSGKCPTWRPRWKSSCALRLEADGAPP